MSAAHSFLSFFFLSSRCLEFRLEENDNARVDEQTNDRCLCVVKYVIFLFLFFFFLSFFLSFFLFFFFFLSFFFIFFRLLFLLLFASLFSLSPRSHCCRICMTETNHFLPQSENRKVFNGCGQKYSLCCDNRFFAYSEKRLLRSS